MGKRSPAPERRGDASGVDGKRRYLGMMVSTLYQNILRSLSVRTNRYGVLPGFYGVIALLIELEEATQTTLSSLLGVEQPTMAKTLKRMERDGLVERTVDKNDARSRRIRLSMRGKEVSDFVLADVRDMQAIAYAGIANADIEHLLDLLDKIGANLMTDERLRP